MHILDIMRERGYLAQITFPDELYKKLENESITVYAGFDPTADSMQIGHFIPIMLLSYFQRAGHRPIALMGGGTAVIGDPSGRTDLRQMLTREQIDTNVAGIKSQMSRHLDFSEGKALMVNNADWLLDLNYAEFIRDIGVHFSVNRMLTAECYKARMEKGLTFLEFNYMLMQSYDFLQLFQTYGCSVQIGGDDQWSNILAGADLIRRKLRKEAYAVTSQLLMTKDGKKMGKTAAGAVWMSPERTSPYDFYQYFRNVDDADVEKFLLQLTFLPTEECKRLGALQGADINEAKRTLAMELTTLIHGSEVALEAQRAAESLFGGGSLDGSVPTTAIARSELGDGKRMVEILTLCSLAKSLGDGRRLIAGGGITVDGKVVSDSEALLLAEDIPAEGILLRKGKKTYHRLVLSE